MKTSVVSRVKNIERGHPHISINKQCELLGLSRNAVFYTPIPETDYNLKLMDIIDRQYLETPFYGRRKMCAHLRREGHEINPKRVGRLMSKMGLYAIYPGKNTSKRNHEHKVYPYLLRGMKIARANQVWACDITYLRLLGGFAYLVAIIDWYSRFVLAWRLSNSLDSTFCTEATEDAISIYGVPDIYNTDQGCQFTSNSFTGSIEGHGIAISMDGKGRALDNVMIERLWRSLKYEEVYLKGYSEKTMVEAKEGLAKYFNLYNNERPHQSLGYNTPYEIYTGEVKLEERQ